MFKLPPPPFKEKEITHHPLEKSVKFKYARYLKYAHNSVHNPNYPKEKVEDEKEKYKFTIIGCRTHEAFIYCKHFFTGLYKYKSKVFDAPVIRAVTSVQWPLVLWDLRLRFGGIAYCLQDPVIILLNGELLGGINELKEFMQCKYSYYLKLDYPKLSVDAFAKHINSMKRPCVYMHISIDEEYAGALIFMLYSDVVPITSENFLRRCREPKGGYSGTPIHRIVKDGWIQCGGYGLKDTPMACENFIIPHDRRGVIGMANDGRHRDCSTQFFVLLQPSPWMIHKYVAFGELIDGNETLNKIENVPTFYESPSKKIMIDKIGILNMECHGKTINKEAHSYIHGHIEDLINLASTLWEELMQRVFTTVDHHPKNIEFEAEQSEVASVRETKSFRHDKSNIQDHASDNNDFDVESYAYEPEEYHYPQVTPASSLVVPPEDPYYIPLTDVPYPDEKDSTYDLKKYLRGDYCLESDIKPELVKKVKLIKLNKASFDASDMFDDDIILDDSGSSLDSDDENEVKNYIKFNSDNISFAGNVIKGISKAGTRINFNNFKSKHFTDEGLRKLSMVAHHRKHSRYGKKVSMSVEPSFKESSHSPIRRRPTGFIRSLNESDAISLRSERSFDGSSRKVRIIDKTRMSELDKEFAKQSVMARLFNEAMAAVNESQNMKERRISNDKYIAMTYSPLPQKPEASEKDTNHHYDLISLHDKMLIMQHEHKHGDNVSTDYVRSLMHPKHSHMKSLRAHEYARTRPMMTVDEYQARNRANAEALKSFKEVKDLFISSGGPEIQTTENTPINSDSSKENIECD